MTGTAGDLFVSYCYQLRGLGFLFLSHDTMCIVSCLLPGKTQHTPRRTIRCGDDVARTV